MNNSDCQYLLQGDKRNEWLVANDIQTNHIDKFFEKVIISEPVVNVLKSDAI